MYNFFCYMYFLPCFLLFTIGLPTDPKIVSKNFSHHRNSYTLEWYYEQAEDENRVLYFTYCYLNKQVINIHNCFIKTYASA